jgi:hypothetical protein
MLLVVDDGRLVFRRAERLQGGRESRGIPGKFDPHGLPGSRQAVRELED